MAGLTRYGYEARTYDEIKADLINKIKLQGRDFETLPAEIQNNLIDCSLQIILEFEALINDCLNSFSLNNQNDFIFNLLAESVGIKKKGAEVGSADIQFKGAPLSLIPAQTKITTKDKSATFITSEALLLNEAGVGIVKAYADTQKIYAQNQITELETILKDTLNVSATNLQQSVANIAEETQAEYKARAQAINRTSWLGGMAFALSKIKGLQGVDSRLVNGRVTEIKKSVDNKEYFINGIEIIVGGGNQNDIALILYKSFFDTSRLLSNPSNNEADRTISLNISTISGAQTIVFTRPKSLQLDLKFIFEFVGSYFSKEDLYNALYKPINSLIQSISVGERLGEAQFNELIYSEFKAIGLSAQAIRKITTQYALDTPEGTKTDDITFKGLDNENKIPLNFDNYLTLNNLIIEFA